MLNCHLCDCPITEQLGNLGLSDDMTVLCKGRLRRVEEADRAREPREVVWEPDECGGWRKVSETFDEPADPPLVVQAEVVL